MTPKEKAIELVNKYKPFATCIDSIRDDSKQCALIAVDEILPIVEGYEDALSISQQSDYLEYWQEVKKEIDAL